MTSLTVCNPLLWSILVYILSTSYVISKQLSGKVKAFIFSTKSYVFYIYEGWARFKWLSMKDDTFFYSLLQSDTIDLQWGITFGIVQQLPSLWILRSIYKYRSLGYWGGERNWNCFSEIAPADLSWFKKKQLFESPFWGT